MDRHRLATVCVLLAAATAGCSGVFDGETTTATPTVSGPDIAPGVPAVEQNGSEVSVDTDRLRAANERVRATISYTVERTVTVRDGDDGTLDFERTRLVTPDATLERLDIDESDRLTAVLDNGTRWTDPDGTWTRTTLSNGRTIVSERLGDELDPYGYGDELVERTLSADAYQVRTPAAGAVLLTRDIDLQSQSLIPLSTGPPIDERARLVVDGSGLVRSLAVRYDAVYETQTVTVTIRHNLRNVGATTLQRPAWVPTGN